MIPDPYDRTGRFLVRNHVPLLGWFLALRPHQYQFVDWLDTRSLPWPGDSPEKVRDTLAHLLDRTTGGVPWAVGAEFQLQPDPDMVSRMMIYLGEARLQLRPTDLPGDRFHVGGVVINLTGKGHSSLDMHWAAAGLRTCMQIREIDLASLDAGWALDQIDQGLAPLPLLAFIPLMQRGTESAIIQRWLVLAAREKDYQRRLELGFALTFAEAAGCAEVWQEALKGWNMIESKVFNEWVRQALEREKRNTKVQTKTEDILELLADRGSVPADLEAAIRAITDPTRLSELLRLAGRVATVDQFRQDAGL
jgi:hypothetical protein